ncbi:MAG TPA: alginate O-acetyltransferase, partial [Spirochaetia bacterium]
WTFLRYRLFGEARQEVLVGSDGWLFSTEEFAPPAPLAVPLPQALERIDAARAVVEAKGVDLVVALVPSKASVEGAHLGRYQVPPGLDARYEAARAGIAGLGIAAPDLRTPLIAAAATEDMYLRTDTHWTPAGARQAADVLAATIIPLLVKSESARIAFDTETGSPEPLQGDLLKFVPLGPWQDRGPAPDTVAIPHAAPEATAQEAAEDDGLFGEIDIPVALVGTSYSANPTSGFETALKDALDADVLNVAVEGEGPFEPMEAYLGSSAIDDPRPDVIVWEIPERYLIP